MAGPASIGPPARSRERRGSNVMTDNANEASNDSVSADDNSGTEQLVVMRLAKEDYGVDITVVREIIRMQKITEVPQAPAYVEGIINLRGSVIPVVDLRKRFDLPVAEVSSDTRIVVVDVRSHTVGLVVDTVMEVISVPTEAIEPVGSLTSGGSLTTDLRGIVKLAENLIILINLENLLETIADTEFSETAAAA